MAESRDERPAAALSFAAVADAYDRARPTYPREAAVWLVGQHADDWLTELREAMTAVADVRAKGPAA